MLEIFPEALSNAVSTSIWVLRRGEWEAFRSELECAGIRSGLCSSSQAGGRCQSGVVAVRCSCRYRWQVRLLEVWAGKRVGLRCPGFRAGLRWAGGWTGMGWGGVGWDGMWLGGVG